jgi:IS1 family transposase
MNRLNSHKRTAIIAALVEGNSLRATARMTGVAINTVVKLLIDAGIACAEYQDKALLKLTCKKVQCDEIWAFCYAKEKNVPEDKRGQFGFGDVWTWVAIDPETKLVISWFVGKRNAECAKAFMKDISERLTHRVQLTTDGLRAYLEAVDEAFGADIDYAQLVKLYGQEDGGAGRYSPPKCNGTRKHTINGKPDKRHISTSYIERQNLTMRMNMRRFTRLTNAFSKKVENLAHAIALHYMYYNFCRIHQTLRVSPAMEAGVTNKFWAVRDIVKLVEEKESKKPDCYTTIF